LTSDQLRSTRLERWRHQGNPLLTIDDARTWLASVGFCLFLPRRAHFLASGPSFVEAVDGAASETPSRAQIEAALERMRRLATAGDAVPLNFFGGAGGASTDQPDFLASREAFPYLFSLIGGRNWKSGPGASASPLVLEIWKLLNEGGSLEATEIQATLGREVTEGAVLRGLMELWSGARAIPAYEQDGPTRWELTQRRFAAEMTASQKIAQPTALSALVSLYLESAVAASADEVETFLSPLTARSRVREVLNGLNATRQLELVPVGTQLLFAVAGSLPEFADAELPKTADTGGPEAGEVDRLEAGTGDKPIFERKPPRTASEERPRRGPGEGRLRYAAGRRPALGRERTPRPAGHRSGPSRAGSSRAGSSRPGYSRPGTSGPDGERRPWPRKAAENPGGERAGGSARPKRSGYDRSEKPAGERRPYGKRATGGERPPFRSDAARPAFRPEGGKFPPRKFGAGKSDADRRGSGPEKPAFRADGAPPQRGGKRPYERPGYPAKGKGATGGSFGGKPKFAGRPSGGMRGKSGGAESGEKRPFFRKRREEGETGARPFRPSGASGRSASAAGDGGPRREGGFPPKGSGGYGAKSGARFAPSSGARPASGAGSGYTPRPGSKPGFGGGAGPKSGGKFRGKPAFGKSKLGGKPGGRFTSPRGPSAGQRSSSPENSEPRSGSTGSRAGGGAQRGPGASASFKPGFKAGGKAKTGSKFGSKSAFRGGPGSKYGSKPGGKYGPKSGGGPGSKPGGRPGAKPGGGPGSQFPPRKRRDKGEGKKDAE
jgi:23S rRNA pseudouridine2605 synthase